MKEFTEVESGKRTDLPELEKAFQACRVYGAKLVIAKLDSLSRNAHFLLGLEKAGIDFVAADIPSINRLTAGIMAPIAEEGARMISKRTKDALAAASRFPEDDQSAVKQRNEAPTSRPRLQLVRN